MLHSYFGRTIGSINYRSRPQTVVSLTEMIQDKRQVGEALSLATYQQDLELHHKRFVVESSILCPLSHEVQSHVIRVLDRTEKDFLADYGAPCFRR